MSPHRRAASLTACAVLLAGCASGDVATDESAVTVDQGEGGGGDAADGDVPATEVARALAWVPPTSYVLELEASCFCPVQRFRVTVEDGEVVERTALDDTGTPTEAPAPPAYALSLEELLALLRDVHEGEGEVTTLELDDEGAPLLVGVDPLPSAADDEVTVRVLDLRT